MAFTRSFMIRVLAAALGLLSVYAALQAQSTDTLFDDTGALQEIRFMMNHIAPLTVDFPVGIDRGYVAVNQADLRVLFELG